MKQFKIFFFFAFLLQYALLSTQMNAQTVDAPGPISEIAFANPTFNYGVIESGEVVQTIFTFTNTSDEPLIISNAKGSCGCTVPEWPKAPIAPGETGQFVVRFNSKNKLGMQSKRVTITANTEPAHTYLTIKGEVLEAIEKIEIEQPSGDEIAKQDIVKPKLNLVDVDPNNVLIYPNPSSDIVNVNLKELAGKPGNIFIYNSTGQLLSHKAVDQITNQDLSYDVSNFQNGIYTISVKVDGMHRIAKQFSVIR